MKTSNKIKGTAALCLLLISPFGFTNSGDYGAGNGTGEIAIATDISEIEGLTDFEKVLFAFENGTLPTKDMEGVWSGETILSDNTILTDGKLAIKSLDRGIVSRNQWSIHFDKYRDFKSYKKYFMHWIRENLENPKNYTVIEDNALKITLQLTETSEVDLRKNLARYTKHNITIKIRVIRQNELSQIVGIILPNKENKCPNIYDDFRTEIVTPLNGVCAVINFYSKEPLNEAETQE